MAIKLIVLLACIVACSAGIIAPAAPVVARFEEFDPHPQYTYGYDVKDALSGDSKSQVETRDGDLVQGQYSLNDADGFRRIVDYSADSVNGFNAVVRREPIAVAVRSFAAPALAAPIIKASPPAVVKTAAIAHPAPLVYAGAAPAIFKTSFASPLISYAY